MSPGLPEIYGWMDVQQDTVWAKGGAFYGGEYMDDTVSAGQPGVSIITHFLASRCSNIYGNSDTVKPASLMCKVAIKY